MTVQSAGAGYRPAGWSAGIRRSTRYSLALEGTVTISHDRDGSELGQSRQ